MHAGGQECDGASTWKFYLPGKYAKANLDSERKYHGGTNRAGKASAGSGDSIHRLDAARKLLAQLGPLK